MRNTAYCKWHDKTLSEVAEHEMETCEDAGIICENCENMTAQGVEDEDILDI